MEVYVIARESFFDGECYGTMAPLADASCRYVLNHMSTSVEDVIFGSGDPESVTNLPYTIVSREWCYWIMITKLANL